MRIRGLLEVFKVQTCRFNMKKALRLSVVWQTILFFILAPLVYYVGFGTYGAAAEHCKTPDTPGILLLAVSQSDLACRSNKSWRLYICCHYSAS